MRELRFAGDWYRPKTISESQSTAALGIFRSVQMAPSRPLDRAHPADQVDIVVQVEEGSAGFFLFGPGYSLQKGAHYTGEVTYNNMWGIGHRASVLAGVSAEKNQSNIQDANETHGKIFLGRKLGATYTDPYVLDYPVSATARLFHTAVADVLWKITNMFDLSASYELPLVRGFTVSPYYNFKLNFDDGTSLQEDLLLSLGKTTSRPPVRLKLDRRDSPGPAGLTFTAILRWRATVSTSITIFGGRGKRYISFSISYLPWHQRNDVRAGRAQLGPTPICLCNRAPIGWGRVLRAASYSSRPLCADRSHGSDWGTRHFVLKGEVRRQLIPQKLGTSLFMDRERHCRSARCGRWLPTRAAVAGSRCSDGAGQRRAIPADVAAHNLMPITT